jgi:polyferredoxin
MKLQIKRWISQIIFAITANLGAFGVKTGFCYPFFYCHSCPASTSACPIRAIEIGAKNSDWKFFLYPFMIIGAVGVISGRAVCGWACPIGSLQRVTGGVAKKLKKRFNILEKIGKLRIERYFRFIKYFDLIGLAIIIYMLIGIMFTDLCPTGFLVGTIPISLLNPGEYVPNQYFYIALVIFILFIILIFVVERGWCKYFCPVGAMLAPFNKASIYHVSVDKEKCLHCNICSIQCPMGIDVPNMVRDPECIICGKCVNVCPSNIIEIRRF